MSARPTRARGRAAGRAPWMPAVRFAQVGTLADRVVADWRALDGFGGDVRSPRLAMALSKHFADLDALFAGGVRLGQFARALRVRGLTVGRDTPVSSHAFGMVWLRLERRLAADASPAVTGRSAQGAPAEERREMAA